MAELFQNILSELGFDPKDPNLILLKTLKNNGESTQSSRFSYRTFFCQSNPYLNTVPPDTTLDRGMRFGVPQGYQVVPLSISFQVHSASANLSALSFGVGDKINFVDDVPDVVTKPPDFFGLGDRFRACDVDPNTMTQFSQAIGAYNFPYSLIRMWEGISPPLLSEDDRFELFIPAGSDSVTVANAKQLIFWIGSLGGTWNGAYEVYVVAQLLKV